VGARPSRCGLASVETSGKSESLAGSKANEVSDSYRWTSTIASLWLAASETMKPVVFPLTTELYTAEQSLAMNSVVSSDPASSVEAVAHA
jgi:hypothetical protein